MKRAARFINDTLFVSNFGSILVSITRYGGEGFPHLSTILFALFFLLFRIKTYLDDNASLIKTEAELYKDIANPKPPNSAQKLSLIVSFISWIFYSISGFFVFTHLLSAYFFLGISLLIFMIWILVRKKEKGEQDEAEKKEVSRQKMYFWFNLGYLICLIPLCIQLNWCIINTIYVDLALLFMLLVLVIEDYRTCKSLDEAFK